jgi:beta-1,4-mannooligosaccharide/beta-1,4-mannosyl-N-acetylglucosamine phosphorylase
MAIDLDRDPGIFARHAGNPVLSPSQAPYPCSLAFNAGVAKADGHYIMLFRNDVFERKAALKHLETNLGLALSDDGVRWQVQREPRYKLQTDEILRAYDPRLTVTDGRFYLCLAVDTRHGIRGAIAVTDDFSHVEVLILSAPDNRNMVLFPRKIRGRYVRLERPFAVYGKGPGDRFDIWCSDSPDLRYWGNTRLVLGCEQVAWCNNKIGPTAPPIETPRGWLTLIHVVDRNDRRPLPTWEQRWTKRYTVGLVLLDLEEPWRLVGMCPRPVMVPDRRYPYEVEGFRGSVLFPTGMIAEDDGTVKVYYGASDTVVALATARIDDLLDLCEPL